jgi:hypothetical protein
MSRLRARLVCEQGSVLITGRLLSIALIMLIGFAVEAALATLDLEQRQRTTLDLDDACAILEALPDLGKRSPRPDPELRRYIYEAFQFAVELDRNTPEVRMKALVSSAFRCGERPGFNRGHGRP